MYEHKYMAASILFRLAILTVYSVHGRTPIFGKSELFIRGEVFRQCVLPEGLAKKLPEL